MNNPGLGEIRGGTEKQPVPIPGGCAVENKFERRTVQRRRIVQGKPAAFIGYGLRLCPQ
jgi:hypothetical protein